MTSTTLGIRLVQPACSRNNRLGLFVALTAAVTLLVESPAMAYVPQAGDRAAELVGRDILSGRMVDLECSRGKWTYLEFMSIDCGPCIRGLPDLQEAARSASVAGIQVILASADAHEKVPQLRRLLRKTGFSSPVLSFGSSASSVAGSWNVSGFPVAYLISPQQDIACKVVGARDCLSLLNLAERFLHHDKLYERVGLRCSLGECSADTCSLRVELSSPAHVPLEVEVCYSLLKIETDAQGNLVSAEHIDPRPGIPELAAHCEVGQWADTVLDVSIDLKGYQGVQFKVRVKLPTAGADVSPELWSEQRGRILLQDGQHTFEEWF